MLGSLIYMSVAIAAYACADHACKQSVCNEQVSCFKEDGLLSCEHDRYKNDCQIVCDTTKGCKNSFCMSWRAKPSCFGLFTLPDQSVCFGNQCQGEPLTCSSFTFLSNPVGSLELCKPRESAIGTLTPRTIPAPSSSPSLLSSASLLTSVGAVFPTYSSSYSSAGNVISEEFSINHDSTRSTTTVLPSMTETPNLRTLARQEEFFGSWSGTSEQTRTKLINLETAGTHSISPNHVQLQDIVTAPLTTHQDRKVLSGSPSTRRSMHSSLSAVSEVYGTRIETTTSPQTHVSERVLSTQSDAKRSAPHEQTEQQSVAGSKQMRELPFEQSSSTTTTTRQSLNSIVSKQVLTTETPALSRTKSRAWLNHSPTVSDKLVSFLVEGPDRSSSMTDSSRSQQMHSLTTAKQRTIAVSHQGSGSSEAQKSDPSKFGTQPTYWTTVRVSEESGSTSHRDTTVTHEFTIVDPATVSVTSSRLRSSTTPEPVLESDRIEDQMTTVTNADPSESSFVLQSVSERSENDITSSFKLSSSAPSQRPFHKMTNQDGMSRASHRSSDSQQDLKNVSLSQTTHLPGLVKSNIPVLVASAKSIDTTSTLQNLQISSKQKMTAIDMISQSSPILQETRTSASPSTLLAESSLEWSLNSKEALFGSPSSTLISSSTYGPGSHEVTTQSLFLSRSTPRDRSHTVFSTASGMTRNDWKSYDDVSSTTTETPSQASGERTNGGWHSSGQLSKDTKNVSIFVPSGKPEFKSFFTEHDGELGPIHTIREVYTTMNLSFSGIEPLAENICKKIDIFDRLRKV